MDVTFEHHAFVFVSLSGLAEKQGLVERLLECVQVC